jgi:hypothetical protein
MRRAERREGDAELGVGDGDVARVGERRVDERARLVVGAVAVRRDPADEIGLKAEPSLVVLMMLPLPWMKSRCAGVFWAVMY